MWRSLRYVLIGSTAFVLSVSTMPTRSDASLGVGGIAMRVGRPSTILLPLLRADPHWAHRATRGRTPPAWSRLRELRGVINESSTGPSDQLACTSGGACVAAGYGRTRAALATQAAGTWGPVTLLADPPKYSGFNAVSCWGAGECVAVGTWYANPSVAMWTKETQGRWSAVRRIPGTYGDVTDYSRPGSSIACVEDGYCVAGGAALVNGKERSYLQVLSGGRWGAPFAVGPHLSSSAQSWITTISCSRPGLCVAGGIVRDANESSFVAFEVNGAWHLDRPILSGVASSSCDAFGTCVISGWQYAPSQLNGRVSLVTFDTGHWSAPLARGPLASFAESVASCAPERAACTVLVTESVSSTGGFGQVYAATLDAHDAWSWRRILSGSNAVTGLNCSSRLVCDAVGSSTTAPRAMLFMMRRDGRWLPASHDGQSAVEGLGPPQIACSAEDYCTAIATGTTSHSVAITFYADLPASTSIHGVR